MAADKRHGSRVVVHLGARLDVRAFSGNVAVFAFIDCFIGNLGVAGLGLVVANEVDVTSDLVDVGFGQIILRRKVLALVVGVPSYVPVAEVPVHTHLNVAGSVS